MKVLFAYMLAVLTAIAAVNVYAETLISDAKNTLPPFYSQLQDGNWNWTDGIGLKDKDTNQAFRLFCSDLYTYTSSDFNNGTGQVYNTTSLADSSFHTEMQKAQLQSLFDHVYTKAFNDDYSYNDGFMASIFQLAVWEIANDTSDHLSLRDGDIRLKGMANTASNTVDNNALRKALTTLDDWFYAIVNDAWGEIGYGEDRVNLTVYLAEGGTDKSQTFIGVAPTPEPATMLIIGLGIAGAAVTRKMKRK